MINNIEVLVNEYWEYSTEPFNIIRFMEDNNKYLFGKEIYESSGIIQARKLKKYLKPTKEQIEQVEKLIKNEN